jgi:hypothetical protein
MLDQSERKTLDQVMIFHESDKASQFSRTYAKPHDYCRHLEPFFAPMRDKPIKLIEIGCGGGESMRAWLEYFPNAQVFGVDLVANTNPWNSPKEKPHDRYTFMHGNQASEVFWASVIKEHGGDWDIIIDDGSHITKDTVAAWGCLWKHVKPGGIYEIEDLDSMPDLSPLIGRINANVINGNGDCDAIYFARELVIMRKK